MLTRFGVSPLLPGVTLGRPLGFFAVNEHQSRFERALSAH